MSQASEAIARTPLKPAAEPTAAPRIMGTAHLRDKDALEGISSRQGSVAVTGEVVFGAQGQPIGVRVPLTEAQRTGFRNVDYHWIPESACRRITVRRAP